MMLVGFWHSEEYQADQKEFITMESADTTHLPCGASTYEAIQIDGSNERLQDTGLASLFTKWKIFTQLIVK